MKKLRKRKHEVRIVCVSIPKVLRRLPDSSRGQTWFTAKALRGFLSSQLLWGHLCCQLLPTPRDERGGDIHTLMKENLST